MKKTNKPVSDYVYDTMVGLTNQINLSFYAACAKMAHPGLVTEPELRDAKMQMDFSWSEVERKIDTVRKEFYNLLNKRKWEKAESLFRKYKFDLNEYMNDYLSQTLVKQYVSVGLRDKINRTLLYTPGCNAIIFGEKGEKEEEIIIDQKIADSESLYAFWRGICNLCSFANMVAEQMKEDLNNKQYVGDWNKYDKPSLTFHDLFVTFAGMRSALNMLEELNVLNWNGELPVLSMQKILIKGMEETTGKGIKTFLGAWLSHCKYDKGWIRPDYNDTLIAKVTLTHFGWSHVDENAVREMIGGRVMFSSYLKFFKERKFGEKKITKN